MGDIMHCRHDRKFSLNIYFASDLAHCALWGGGVSLFFWMIEYVFL